MLLSERFLKTEPKKTLSYKPKKQSPLTLSTESNLRLQLLWWPTSSVVLVSLQRQGLTPLSGPTPVITQVSRHTQFYEQSKKHSLQWKNSSHRFQRLPVSSFQVAESAALGNEGRRLSSMKDYRFNVSKDCRQQPKPMHLRGQSMASMWMSGDVSAWKLGVPPQCHVCQEKIRVFIIHLQLWTAKIGGRTADPGTTPNPYFPGLCNKRNIHLHRWKRDGREKERRQLLLQVEYRKVDSPSSTVYEDKPMSTFHVSWATTLRSSSQNFPGHSENHPVSPQNSI